MGLRVYFAVFMIFYNIAIAGLANFTSTSTCYPPDLAALRAFARSFPSANFSDWQASDDCCAWGPREVKCTNGRVTQLFLAAFNEYFSGGRFLNLNFSLCSLSALSSLTLVGWHLGTAIPHCIGTNLHNLVYLDLRQNALTGSIPPSFSRLQSLQSLSLQDNSLSGPLPSFLFDVLLLNLISLDLGFNFFSGSLPAAFNAPNLSDLYLNRNSFSGSLPAAFNAPNLSFLYLDHNSFSGSISHLIFPPTLTDLDLSYNLLNGSIPESLCQLTELHYLDLSSNSFSGKLFASADDLCGQPKFLGLQELDLSNNQLVGAFPSCFGYLLDLGTLDLSYNNFKGSLPSSWRNFTSLNELSLSGNTLVSASPSAPSLPRWLFHLPNLGEIHLHSTGLQVEDLGCSLPHHPVFNYTFLHSWVLDISYNNLSADVLRCFQEASMDELNMSGNPLALNLNNPKQVMLLPQITMGLDLSSCELSGSLTDLFFDGMALSQYLYLSNNHLVGRIPARLANLSYLQTLDLAHNAFTSFEGRIPLRPFFTINLSNNKFAGCLSSTISFMIDLPNRTAYNSGEVVCDSNYNIQDLDLSHNFLTGSIPPYLGQCISTRIKLNNNQLEGAIPPSLFENITDEYLQIVSLSNNQLTGEIPPSMKNLKHLQLLDLSHNQLHGNLEDALFTNASDHFRELRVLILGSNSFKGPIPVSLGSLMPALQIIDLSNNQLTGSIPNSLGNLPAFRVVERSQSSALAGRRGILFEEIRIKVKGSPLDYQYVLLLLTSLDLSSNNLSGPIPRGLGALSGLVSLDFSKNKLSGEIPPDLGMLVEQLQSLDLSFNELVGSIPSNFSSLTKLEVFNVSYNKGLHGPIPFSPQFENADSYIGDPDLCGGLHVLRPCTIDNSSTTTQPHMTRDGSDKQISHFARWIDEWIAVPGLCLGIVVGFAGTLWALVYFK